MRFLPAILLGRFVRVLVRLVRPGGGSALPGLVVSKVAPGLLAATLSKFSDGLIVVTGSAGKSTTTKMLVGIARAHGKTVFTNPSTANIAQGFFSSIIEQSDIFGRIKGDVAILEMDEGHAEEITRLIRPKQVTILNVLEDQLDRFVDPAVVRDKLAQVARRANDTVLLNADDQNTLIINRDVQHPGTKWFGITGSLLAEAKHGLGTAPTYEAEIARPIPSAEVMRVDGLRASVILSGAVTEVELPNRGLHFALDAIAALQSAEAYLGADFDLELASNTITTMPPVFARGEIAVVNGEEVEFILVQNPMSFQLNLDNLTTNPERIMVMIGRDVHDPSWLWTVNMDALSHADVVSGYNAYEMALRLAYSDIPVGFVTDDLQVALDTFFELPAPTHSRRTVIFSADAMRRTRRMLGFTDPEAVSR